MSPRRSSGTAASPGAAPPEGTASGAAPSPEDGAAAGTARGTTAPEPDGAAEARSPEDTPAGGGTGTAAPDPEETEWTGRQAWSFPAITAAFGAVCLYGAATIETPPHAASPGPAAMPAVVGALLLVTAACMAAVVLRTARRGTAPAPAVPTAWRPVLLVIAALAVHAAVLPAVGWLLSGAALFWTVAYAFGARSPVRDTAVALAMSAAVQVGFSLGLGLNLPGGVLELVLS
ncbi:tripartite tricarboxylate transporter TctB family protein [Nocardiopsis coralliicola]